MTVTITIQPDRTHGDFLLDFVSGIANAASPTDPTVNSNGAAWEAGGIYDHSNPAAEPPGTALDQPCTLLPSEDPSVLSTTPADGATDVALATDPKVKFSEAMDAATMTAAKLFVRPTGGRHCRPRSSTTQPHMRRPSTSTTPWNSTPTTRSSSTIRCKIWSATT